MDLGKGTSHMWPSNNLHILLYILDNSRSWGVCFTYGTWFGLEALACMNRRYDLGLVLDVLVHSTKKLIRSNHLTLEQLALK